MPVTCLTQRFDFWGPIYYTNLQDMNSIQLAKTSIYFDLEKLDCSGLQVSSMPLGIKTYICIYVYIGLSECVGCQEYRKFV